MKISVIIPVYNEEKTINEILDKVLKLKLDLQIIIVDDFSNDGTTEIIKKLENKVDKVLYHKKNQGKGAAIKTAKNFCKGDLVIIQDADLEYNPNDYFKLIKPILEKKSNVVYGSRVLGKKRYEVTNFTSTFRIFCNHILTILSNIINNQNLTDAHTCYKILKIEVFNKINLVETRFGFCPELTTKLSNLKETIFEVPIEYNGRTHKNGKKISFKDGVRAIYCLIKYKFF